MKSFRKTLRIETKCYYDFVRITEKVQEVVRESGIKKGIVFLNSLHNTAALLIQEDDPTIFEDLKSCLERVTPLKAKYHHSYEGNKNATAHIKTNLLHSSLSVPVEDGKLVLGTWQHLWFVELFEPRERKDVVTVLGE